MERDQDVRRNGEIWGNGRWTTGKGVKGLTKWKADVGKGLK